jgi:hypothetical protein
MITPVPMLFDQGFCKVNKSGFRGVSGWDDLFSGDASFALS